MTYICPMKRNLLYLMILVVLGFLTYYFVFREDQPDYDIQEANFTVKNVDDIITILLTDLQGQKIKLTKKEDEWIANDTIEITQSRVKDLLDALHNQEPLQPVKLGSHDEVIKAMSANNTKVEVFTAKGKTHTFYVSKVTAPNNLTYMLTEGAKRPYIVKLPLQNVFLGLRYSTEMRDWRSKKIMRAKADEIEMIDVAYKDSSQYSFHLLHEKGKTPIVTGTQSSANPLNINRVQSYMRLWDSIYCLGFEARNRIKDTILTEGKEVATVSMKKANHPLQTLTIYFKPVSKGTKGILKVGNEEFDFDVFIGFLNKTDMLVINRHFAEIMLRSYPEFFETDKLPAAPQQPK